MTGLSWTNSFIKCTAFVFLFLLCSPSLLFMFMRRKEKFIHERTTPSKYVVISVSYFIWAHTIKCHINSHIKIITALTSISSSTHELCHPPSWHWIFFFHFVFSALWVLVNLDSFSTCNHGYIYFGSVESRNSETNSIRVKHKQWPS